jgi:ATP-dependent helicase STH1/SNF2
MDKKVIEAGKFNHQTDSKERDKLLLRLLREKDDDDQNEKEIPSEEDLNRILSRSPEEFDLFQTMDQERIDDDAAFFSKPENANIPSTRLMAYEEIPEWLKLDVKAALEEEMKFDHIKYGRGHREKKSEGLVLPEDVDEDTFIKMMEEREMAMREKGPRRGKRKNDDTKGPTAKKSRPDPNARVLPFVENPSDELKNLWKQQYFKIFSYLRNVKDLEGDEGRLRSEIFMYLPHEDVYKDYYLLIKNPLSMDMIREKIENGDYVDPQIFYNDFVLMFNNAKTYNQEGSLVYSDAQVLSELFETEFQERFVAKFEHNLHKSIELHNSQGVKVEEAEDIDEDQMISEQLDKDDKKLHFSGTVPRPDNMDSYLDMYQTEENEQPPPKQKPQMLMFDFDDNAQGGEGQDKEEDVEMIDALT